VGKKVVFVHVAVEVTVRLTDLVKVVVARTVVVLGVTEVVP
jgi:hypothetical protein